MMGCYTCLSDEEVEQKISTLPEHLKKIFDDRIQMGCSRRQALFFASSFPLEIKKCSKQ